MHDLKVGGQSLLEHRMSEQTALRDFTHQELYDNRQLVYGLVESRRCFRRRCTSYSLLEVCMGFAIVQLNGLDATQVIVEPGKLRVSSRCGERSF